jgi:7,8-dihydropterin-6-yl-methyl-4-(beta-D-ribofuranosyl)aminobenzene 5'-phosphate synthase
VAAKQTASGRVTVLYDAFGARQALEADWGLALLVEFSGRRILFDTGNNPRIFAHNVRTLGIDLTDLDHVVISHRHGDHTSGLAHLLQVNPDVPIHAPAELFGVFGSSLPMDFYRSVPSLPTRNRYFGGVEPGRIRSGSAWPGANFAPVESPTEIAPDVIVVPTVSDRPGTLEMRELSLALRGRDGLVVVLGCSHPGLEKILRGSRSVSPDLHLVVGGLHLVTASDPDIARLARSLRDDYRLDRIAPGHCTGEPAFAEFADVFRDDYEYAGLGAVLEF